MKTIEVSKLNTTEKIPSMAEVSARLDELGEGHALIPSTGRIFHTNPG